MPRIHIPTGFSVYSTSEGAPAVELRNNASHSLFVHPISDSIVRVVHQLPTAKFPQKTNGGIAWEDGALATTVITKQPSQDYVVIDAKTLKVKVNHIGCPKLEWFSKLGDTDSQAAPFLSDLNTKAYSYDASSGGVYHYVQRELHLPLSEDEFTTAGPRPVLHPERNEFIYGLGESRGHLVKNGKRFTMEGRDALSYDWDEGDPLYKLSPFYTVYNKATELWYGMFYNNLSDSVFDMGAECEVIYGAFRYYRANAGPLDSYVILGDGTLPSIVSQYAALVSPTSAGCTPFAASPTLPPLSPFGYLSSSLTLSAESNARDAVVSFLRQSRQEGFPVDGLYLSSGWCQDPVSGDRNYFVWNLERYPDPRRLAAL